MIKARITPFYEMIFKPYIMRLMKRYFHAIYLVGESSLPDDRPLLLLPNHSTWWDGFFVFLLKIYLFHRPLFLMMLEEQLRRNRFFSHIGVYSINPASLRGNRESLQYTIELLSSQRNIVVCLFPQGELLPWSLQSMHYKRGLEWLLKKLPPDISVCQLAIRCEYLAAQRADVFLQLGPLKCVEECRGWTQEKWENSHQQLLAELSIKIASGEKGRLVMAGKRSINESFERLRRQWGVIRERNQ